MKPALYPKSSRLRKSHEFKLRPSERVRTDLFTFVFSPRGKGRLGISLSKKVLKLSVARNRVRRLLRETFRLSTENFSSVDVHVIGNAGLTSSWRSLRRQDIELEFAKLQEIVGRK